MFIVMTFLDSNETDPVDSRILEILSSTTPFKVLTHVADCFEVPFEKIENFDKWDTSWGRSTDDRDWEDINEQFGYSLDFLVKYLGVEGIEAQWVTEVPEDAESILNIRITDINLED